MLTESYSDDHTVRPALHRQELAEVNGSIFGLQFEEPEKPGLIYGIVVHGAHPKDRARLGYVKVHFPLVDRDRYKTTVDLLSAFPLPTVNEEKIASDAAITPKKTQKDLEN